MLIIGLVDLIPRVVNNKQEDNILRNCMDMYLGRNNDIYDYCMLHIFSGYSGVMHNNDLGKISNPAL
jgi:hypothetical protein